MKDAAPGMPTLAAKVVHVGTRPILDRKPDTKALQFGYLGRTIADNGPHNVLVAESRPGVQSIGNMLSETIARIHDAGDPALGVVRIALRPPFLSDHQDTSMPGEMQG